MRIVGLCGRSGSGKGVFSSVAAQNGIKVIDCDAVYRDMVSGPSACLSDIETHFGSESVKDGALNRPYVAQIVFSSPEKLLLLNNITHKYIRAEIEQTLSQGDPDDIFLIDAPTLFESGIDASCDLVIGIVAPDKLCVSRIVSRDGISDEKALSRLQNQYSQQFIIENCDVILYNDSTLEAFINEASDMITALKEGRV